MMLEQALEDQQTKREQRRVHKQPDEGRIPYDNKAVANGKKLAAALKSNEMQLGELADRLQPKYGDQTLTKFAKEIGVAAATLNRCRSVYRAYKGIEAPEPNFAVAKALQAHPDKAEIIKQYPDLTKRQATTMMQDWRRGQGQDWRVEETRRWFGGVVKRAQEAIKDGHPAKEYVEPAILRQAVDDKDKLLATLRAGGNAWITLADMVESALAPDDPDAAC
jgi:hypothetical protein